MNWSDFLAACALYLVLEGILPFVSPDSWRKGLASIAGLKNGQLRFIGMASISAGLILLLLVRG
jgi:hypothetical protein